MAPNKAPAATLQDTLENGTPAAQANILLDLIEYIAEGKSVSSVVTDVCKVRRWRSAQNAAHSDRQQLVRTGQLARVHFGAT